jgi:hypothetical protein
LNRVGNNGIYQINTIKVFILISLVTSSAFFVNTYLFYQPPYNCKDEFQMCTSFVCSLPLPQRA